MTPPSKSSAPRTLPDLLQGGDPAQPAIVVPGGPTLTYEQLADRVLSLPVHPGVSQADLERIVASIKHLAMAAV